MHTAEKIVKALENIEPGESDLKYRVPDSYDYEDLKHRVPDSHDLEAIKKWSKEEVSGWLVTVELFDFIDVFFEEDVKGDTLFMLTENDVRNYMGLSMGRLKTIMSAIETLKLGRVCSFGLACLDLTKKKKNKTTTTAMHHYTPYNCWLNQIQNQKSGNVRAEDLEISDVKIGGGRFGEVYEAMWLQTKVAVKKMKKGRSKAENQIFLEEIKFLR